MKTKQPFAFKRDRPDLPTEPDSAMEPGQLPAEGESVALDDRHVRDLERKNLAIGAFQIRGSMLERVQLAGGQFGSAIWKDVRFSGCDLANIRAHRISVVRVEMLGCRLTGLRATALDFADVLVRDGDVSYAQFQRGKFRNCEFEGCNWQEADLQEADLTGCVFRSCNLARADLRGARLRNTDFRKSEMEGMLAGVGDLQGAIVDPVQAMVLARLMGLQIL